MNNNAFETKLAKLQIEYMKDPSKGNEAMSRIIQYLSLSTKSNLVNDTNSFNSNVQTLQMEYQKNPTKVLTAMDRGLQYLNTTPNGKIVIDEAMMAGDNIKLKTIVSVVFAVLVLLLGLPTIGFHQGMYYAGAVFFLSGLFIGLFIPIFGLIFLFGHGGIGLVTIIGALTISNLHGNIDLTGIVLNNYVMGAIVSFVIGFIMTIIYSLSKTLHYNPKYLIITFSLFVIGIVLLTLPLLSNI